MTEDRAGHPKTVVFARKVCQFQADLQTVKKIFSEYEKSKIYDPLKKILNRKSLSLVRE